MLKCSLDKIYSVFEEITKTAKLYVPATDNDGSSVYKQWENGMEWSDALNTVRSPKDFFFPQMENLMEFKTEGKNIEVIDTRCETEDFVIFGVRGCDVKSFEVLDRVFLSEPVDSYYASRREKGVIVSTACTKPAETCFCKTFDISPEDPDGDVTTWKTESEIFFRANTPKGEALLEKIKSFTEECDDTAVNEQKEKNPKLCRVTSEALCAFLLKAEEKFNKEKLDVNDRKVVEKFFQENVRDKF